MHRYSIAHLLAIWYGFGEPTSTSKIPGTAGGGCVLPVLVVDVNVAMSSEVQVACAVS